MDDVLKRYFESGPPEMTNRQLEDMCASMAMSYMHAFEPAVMLHYEDLEYGMPNLEEDK